MTQQSRIRWYKLDGHKPVHASAEEANELLGNYDARAVGRFELGPYMVSTVFLCLPANLYADSGPPLLFETAVFKHVEGGERECVDMMRYATWEEAEEGHNERVEVLKMTAGAEE